MASTCLYRHFDKDGKLLYVGVTNHCINRTNGHKNVSSWHLKISSITIQTYSTRKKALEAERIAIKKENPLYNGNSETGKKLRQRRRKENLFYKLPKETVGWELSEIADSEYRTLEQQIVKFIDEGIAAYNAAKKKPLKLIEHKKEKTYD